MTEKISVQQREPVLDLGGLINSLWHTKFWVVGAMLLGALSSGVYCWRADPLYRAETVLVLHSSDAGPSLPAALKGLAGLADISINAPTGEAEAIATLQSRVLIEELIQANSLRPVLFPERWDESTGSWIDDDPEEHPSLQEGVQLFARKVLHIEHDVGRGTISLSVTWTDPNLATDWAAELTERANERLRARALTEAEGRLAYLKKELDKAGQVELRQAIARLMEQNTQAAVMARADPEFAFKTIDPPRVPHKPFSPNGLLMIIGAILGSILGLIPALRRWMAVTFRQ